MNLEREDGPFMMAGFVVMLVVIVIWCVGLYRTAEIVIGWIK
jgi:hypothetical protein